jgi:hypothetical protein
MTRDAARESHLILTDGTTTRHWRARLDGAKLVQTTWADGGRSKETVRALASAAAAAAELDKLERRRFADGYARVHDFDAVPPGGAVFECYGPVLHDLSADGTALALARYGAAKDRWCRVERVEMRTGARRVVFQEPASAPVGPYVHAALFDPAGESLVVLLNTHTFRVDLRTGAREPLAGYEEFRTARFNPHVVRPSQGAERRRLVVFDSGDIVRVVEGGRALLEVSTASPTAECRGARVSPSGRLLAVYRVSRGVVYNHPDARADTTNEVEVWDVDARRTLTKIAMPEPVGQVGFDPADEHLIVSFGCYGPVAYSLTSGEKVWQYGGPDRPLDSICFGWSFSPDGSLLAAGRGHEICLYRGKGRAPVSYPNAGAYRAERIVFSGDGRVFAAERLLNVVVRKTP